MSKIAELLAKKKLAAAKAVEKEVEVEEEEEEEKPTPKKITLKKPSAKKVEEEDEVSDDDVSDEDEVEEEEEKPAPKKAAAKPTLKKSAKVEEDDEEEVVEDDEESSDDEVEEEEEEKPKAKKVVAKPAPKKSAKVEEEDDEESSDDEEDEPKTKLSIKKTSSAKKEVATSASSGKKLLFQKTAKVAKEAKEVEVGGWMPREIWLEKLYTHLGSEEVHGGKFAMPNITTLDTLVKTIEKFLTEDILPDYSISLLGTKMRRVDMPDRIYAPTTGLERVSTKYHTFVPSHTKTTLTLTFGKTSIKGDIVNDNFVEGKFEGSKFIKGKWGVDEEGNETFTPTSTTKKK